MTRTAFVKRSREFFVHERAALDGKHSLQFEAHLKSLICECRALIEGARAIEEDPSNLWQSLEYLQDKFNHTLDGSRFFGLNTSRTLSFQIWGALSEAFGQIGLAFECMEWLRDAEPAQSEREALLVECAAAEAWVHRLDQDYGLQVVDSAQRELHDMVCNERGDFWIPWWKTCGEDVKPLSEVEQAARKLSSDFKAIKDRTEKREHGRRNMTLLTELADSVESEGEFESTIYPAVVRCVEAGIPPSNRELVDVCLPYRSALGTLEDPRLEKLLEYVDRKSTQVLAKSNRAAGEFPDPDLLPSPEYDHWLTEVRKHVKGRTLMVMGGHPQPARTAEIKKVLELKEVVWPESDRSTPSSDMLTEARRVDIVCYCVRWSRHSYKQVVDKVRAEGIETVTIKAGLGVRRLVKDLYDQLIAKYVSTEVA